MIKSVSKYQPTKQVQTYAKKISIAWRQAVEGILEAGRLLQEAHDRLEPKAWLDMINNDLPFERRTAEKLLKIASDKRIINQKHIPHLPPRWTTLHELTFLTDPQFKKAIKSGEIHPDMERKEAEKLTAGNKRQAKAKKKPVVIAKMPKQKHGNGNQIQIIETDKIDQLADDLRKHSGLVDAQPRSVHEVHRGVLGDFRIEWKHFVTEPSDECLIITTT
jgi:hypothetical protein